jgi:hypothetical protein
MGEKLKWALKKWVVTLGDNENLARIVLSILFDTRGVEAQC